MMRQSDCRPLIRALLIDVSGTLHVGSKPTPDAVEALGRLRQVGIPFKLCSNTSKESTQSLLRRLNSQGFDIRSNEQGDSKELWTSIGAVKHVLHDLHCSRPFPLLSQSAREELSDVYHARDDDHGATGFDAVVVGLAPSILTYDNLNTAFRVLVGEDNNKKGKKNRIPLIATNKAKYIQSDSNDRLSLGPGAFVASLEYAAGVQAHVVGKPSKSFFDMVIDSFGGEINNKKGMIAIIGDDVENDLGEGALELGLWRVLVRTGKYRQ
ncbi:hypothetical protein M378DRAFT_194352 [Amanita muscaria Koide BX008]|uniref:Haloacid dehalogenase-like hydrolase domain-containing protein 2 n=1 Tax=Amanita muscaria (strain Koide BX008) TaxID=946122 RepID=A0A0C2SQD0_AMAMK|nr:hypothetical protein M378DRAFT_194352 [Amanita muscaria Koide BX008]